MQEKLPEEIINDLLSCRQCKNFFLPNQSWQRECFGCWIEAVNKAKKNRVPKAILKGKRFTRNPQQNLGGLYATN